MKEKELQLADNILQYVRDRLITAMPLLSQALLRLPVDLNETDIPVSVPQRCGTDGEKIFWEAPHLLSVFRSDQELPSHIFVHMVFHCVYTHMYAYDKLDKQLWNLACDIAVEHVIDQLKLFPGSSQSHCLKETIEGLLSARIPELTAEHIYRQLRQDEDLQTVLLESAEIFRLDDHSFWNEKHYESPDGDLTIYTRAADFFNEKKEWKQVFQTISLLKEERSLYEGSLPGFQHVHVGALTPAERSYAQILQKFAVLQEETELDPDAFDMIFYTYGLTLYGDLPLIEPLEYKESFKIRELVIAIDTSGSCQGDKVRTFLSNTCAILARQQSFFDRFLVYIIQCDSKIQKVDQIRSKEEFERYMCDMEIHGAGGTDFRPVFTHIEEQVNEGTFHSLQGIIYFTDGLGTYPEKQPPYKTLFIYPDEKERRNPTPEWAESYTL